MDYIPLLIGLRVGSQKFSDAIEKLQEQLIESGKLAPNDTLQLNYGEVTEMKAAGVPNTENLQPIYSGERLLLISRSSDNSLLYTKRITVIDNDLAGDTSVRRYLFEDNNLPDKSLQYILPRYRGFALEKAPHTEDMLQYALITLQRYIGRNKAIYHKNFVTMKDEDSYDTRESIRLIREAFNERHYYGRPREDSRKIRIRFPDKQTERKYEELTQWLAKVVYIRAYPFDEVEPADVIAKAFRPMEGLPKKLENSEEDSDSKKLDNPNDITDLFLRMTVLAVSSIIDDMKRFQSGHPLRYTKNISTCAEEMGAIYGAVIGSSYTMRDDETDKYFVPARASKSFEKMYREATGDLAKLSNVCKFLGRMKPEDVDHTKKSYKDKFVAYWEKAMLKRTEYCNNYLFHNRIDKVGECMMSQEEISCAVSISKRVTARGFATNELSGYQDEIFFWGRQSVGTSAGHAGKYQIARHSYTKWHAKIDESIRKLKASENEAERAAAQGLEVFLRELDGVVDSKRRSNNAVEATKEALVTNLREVSHEKA